MSHPSKGKSILAVDVGAGTQDILFFDPSLELENNLKLVLPSQTRILANKVSAINSDILLKGSTMGGGPISAALHDHLKKGYKVFLTPESAKTLRDDLDEVRSDGFTIISEEEADSMEIPLIRTRDVELPMLVDLIQKTAGTSPDILGVALQDHGFEKNKSDRKFRFEKIKETLEKGGALQDFLYNEPPAHYTRMSSLVKELRSESGLPVAVMDSKFAAIAGALHEVKERPVMSVDIGNGHTMAALIGAEGVLGVLEHHTHSLTSERLEDYLIRLADGTVSNDEVFEDNGHGCHIKKPTGIERVKRILVTGPNRKLLSVSKLPIEFASPGGDVMMTGPIGLIDLIRQSENLGHLPR